MSAPHKVTTDLPSNGHWLCRAVILCAVRKFGFLKICSVIYNSGKLDEGLVEMLDLDEKSLDVLCQWL
jgi:hypothetical protein